MSEPIYLLDITFDNLTQCLGKQLVEILELIKSDTHNLTWYGTDVEINGSNAYRLELQGYIPKKIGSIDELISLSKSVDQFLSGIFIALPKDIGPRWNIELSTEDPRFRDIEDAIIEIRAFDTSCFEIYSSDLAIIKKLSNKFSTPIRHKT